MPPESVLAVARDALFGGRWPQGYVPCNEDDGLRLVRQVQTEGRFLERELAERSPAWKQPIPYCVIERGDAWFCVERLRAQGEVRLHGKRSIGLGGHVGQEDATHRDGAILGSLTRELCEELDLGGGALPTPQLMGVLNDDSTEVGRVHFGLVFRLRLGADKKVVVRETLKMQGGWGRLAGPGGLWQDLDRFETWSRILLEAQAAGQFEPFPGPTHPQVQRDHLDRSEEATDG